MGCRTAVGINDDLAPGQAGIAVRPADDEFSTPPNRQRAAEIYAAKILGWRRLRRSEESRLRIRDAYRACVARNGRRHGALQEVAGGLFMNRKAVRRALEDCVGREEMEPLELPPPRKR
jgi:hypothetical protein